MTKAKLNIEEKTSEKADQKKEGRISDKKRQI